MDDDIVQFRKSLTPIRFDNKKYLDKIYHLIIDPYIDPRTGKQGASIEYGGRVLHTFDHSDIKQESRLFIGNEDAVPMPENSNVYTWGWHTHPWFENFHKKRTNYSRYFSEPSGPDMYIACESIGEQGRYFPAIVFSKHYVYQIITNGKFCDLYPSFDEGSKFLSKMLNQNITTNVRTYYDDDWKQIGSSMFQSVNTTLWEMQYANYNKKLNEYGIDIVYTKDWHQNGFTLLVPDHRITPLQRHVGYLPKEMTEFLHNKATTQTEKSIHIFSIMGYINYQYLHEMEPDIFYSIDHDCNDELIAIVSPDDDIPDPVDIKYIANHYGMCDRFSMDQYLILTPTHVFDFRNSKISLTYKDQTLSLLRNTYEHCMETGNSDDVQTYIDLLKQHFNMTVYTWNEYLKKKRHRI